MGILAIDFGGTRTRAAYFSDDLMLLQRVENLSGVGDAQETVIGRIIETGRSVVAGHIDAIGISAPGPLDAEAGIIYHAWTLPGWKDVPLKTLLADAFDAPAFMQNDANLGALAEYHFGAGRGCDPMIYLTISTGIGGGAVINGQLFTGWRGLAVEPGHQVFRLPDSRVKKLEELASGTGLGLLARERLAAADAPSSLRDLTQIDGKAVGEAAQTGDDFALGIVQEAAGWFGLGMVNLLHLFNPQAVVVGGSVAGLGAIFFDPARAAMREYLLSAEFDAPELLRPAALGDDVCLYGAAWWARESLLQQR